MMLRHPNGIWLWLATTALVCASTTATATPMRNRLRDEPLDLSPGAYNPSLVAYRQSYVLINRISEFSGRSISRGGLQLTEVLNYCELCVSSDNGSFSCSPWDPWQGLFWECRCVSACSCARTQGCAIQARRPC
jgi:hypothetical protein